MTRSTINLESNTWSEAEFADTVGASRPTVAKASAEMTEGPRGHYVIITSNGQKRRRYGARALDWWKKNRGEAAGNVTGHGGSREGGGRPKEQSEKRKGQDPLTPAEDGGHSPSEGRGGRTSGAEKSGKSGKNRGDDGTREQRRRAGEMLLREIIDEHGNVDRSLVPRLSTPELKRYVGMQQGLNREQERKVREGQLIERTGAAREWSRKCAAAASEMQQMAARVTDTIRSRLGLEPAAAGIVREVMDQEIARTMSQLSGGAE
jgi:hypothetical protein